MYCLYHESVGLECNYVFVFILTQSCYDDNDLVFVYLLNVFFFIVFSYRVDDPLVEYSRQVSTSSKDNVIQNFLSQ